MPKVIVKWYYGLIIKSKKPIEEQISDALKRLEEKDNDSIS
jgi:hypothetical protein